MRELTTADIEHVSGAGIIADTAETIGTRIGSIMKLAGVPFGSSVGGVLGKSIGIALEKGLDILSRIFGKSQ